MVDRSRRESDTGLLPSTRRQSTSMSRVIITGWEEGLKKISLSRLLQDEAGLTISQAKHAVDEVLEGRRVELTFSSSAAAERFAAAARRLHAVCDVYDIGG